MTAETSPGRDLGTASRGFHPDRRQTAPATEGRPGFRRLAVFRGPATFVPYDGKPEYLRRATPQPELRTGTEDR